MLLSYDPVGDSDPASLVVASGKAQRQTMEMISTDIKPQIEFTLPSPTIGIENLPAVDAAQEPRLSSAAQERNQNEDSDTEHGRSHRANATVLAWLGLSFQQLFVLHMQV